MAGENRNGRGWVVSLITNLMVRQRILNVPFLQFLTTKPPLFPSIPMWAFLGCNGLARYIQETGLSGTSLGVLRYGMGGGACTGPARCSDMGWSGFGTTVRDSFGFSP